MTNESHLEPTAKDLCELPAEIGEGQNYTTRWYYDTTDARCRQFYYGGFGGNTNNFHTEHSCTERCKRPDVVPSVAQPVAVQSPSERQQPQQTGRPANATQFSKADCLLDSDAGECRVAERRYHYNRHEGVCQVFTYGGCGGNGNNFHTAGDCERSCENARDTCELPPFAGDCDEQLTRFYWDARSDQCVEFEYGGCNGNSNNFATAEECAQRCDRKNQQIDSQSVSRNGGDHGSGCNLNTFRFFCC